MTSSAPHSDSARLRAVCCGLALMTVLVYLPVWTHGFVLFDDDQFITNNRVVQAGLTWAGAKWAFSTQHGDYWHPLTWLSLMLDCQLFGLNAGAHHLVSVLFHCANCVLVLLLWRRLTGALWASALTAALFAWHPLRVESVAWATERKDVLSGLFFMLTLLAYAAYVESKVSGPESKVQSPWSIVGRPLCWYLLSLLWFACGLMSKPMLVTAPFVLLLLDYWPLKRVSSAGCRLPTDTFNVPSSGDSKLKTQNSKLKTFLCLLHEKVPFFVLAAASCVMTYLSRGAEASMSSLGEFSLGLRLGNALIAYERYLLKTLWPTNLAVIYPLADSLPWAELSAAVALLAAVSVLVWLARRACAYLLFGWLWFLGTLVPVIGLVQVGPQALADRFTYIPLLGLFVAAAFAARDLSALFEAQPVTDVKSFSTNAKERLRVGRMAIAIPLSLVLLSLMTATRLQLRYWKDSASLFAHAVAVTKDNSLAEVNLGAAYEQQGRTREALIHYREGLRIADEHPHLSDTMVTAAQKAVAYANLGGAFERAGYTEEAASLYRQALSFDAASADLHQRLGSLLVSLDKSDEAVRELAQSARLNPNNPRPHYLMGAACFRSGKSADAIAHFRNALRLNPDDVDSLAFLSRMLAWDADPQIRDPAEAIALAEHANQLSGGRVPMVLDTLAIAYADMGRFEEAEQATRKAIELAGPADQKELVPAMQRRLLRYQSGQPYRETATSSAPGTIQQIQP